MVDLLQLTADLISVPSVSFKEALLADLIESRLGRKPWLDVNRIGDNVIARTQNGKPQRVLLGGHLDTVPVNENSDARLEGDTLWGLGAADMKGGLAIMLALAEALQEPNVDVTYLFYAREEVEFEQSGLREVFELRPDLCVADLALLGEPTLGVVEAGCQGTMRVEVEMAGSRAHTARPWMGRNAIHRVGELLRILEDYEPREPLIESCRYRESLEAVHIEGGVAGNVVPDRTTVTINHRVAPDRSISEAFRLLEGLLEPVIEEGDAITLVDSAPPAPPGLSNPLLAAFVGQQDLQVKAKLGWTDVSFFHSHGVPAANFGPGDPALAHTRDERVERISLEACYQLLELLLTDQAYPGR